MNAVKKKNTNDISELVIRKKLSVINELVYRVKRLKMDEFLIRFDDWVKKQKDGTKTLIDENWTCEEVRIYLLQVDMDRLPPGRNKTSLAQRNVRSSKDSDPKFRIGRREDQLKEKVAETEEKATENEEKALINEEKANKIDEKANEIAAETLKLEKEQLAFEKEKLAFEKEKKAFNSKNSTKKQ